MTPTKALFGITVTLAIVAAATALAWADLRVRAERIGPPRAARLAPPPLTSCERLASLTLPKTTMTMADAVTAGAFAPPGARAAVNVPAFCRVAATLKPSSDSDIKIEVWLPAASWNGKFQGVGNGGWAGTINYAAMAQALHRGYATSSTDTGHASGEASQAGARFAFGRPEKLIDYGYRAVHEMTIAAKAIVAAYYGNGPRLSYFNGCSNGGKQGLKEAQRFPSDYDGIIAGAPAANWTGRAIQSMRVAQAVHQTGAFIPSSKYAVIHGAALQACDALDGAKDGQIDNPARCAFDPSVLACKGADAPACLTSAQVAAAKTMYSPAIDPNTRLEIFPGLEPGSELGWATWGGPQPFAIGVDLFKYVVFQDPSWDYRTFDLAVAAARAEEWSDTLNAIDPNLKAFFGRGGKLLQYHGWSDPQISPAGSVRYYESVAGAMGGASQVQRSYRLFMIPAMAHCGGGDGPNAFDAVGALEEWVEKGQAPDSIVASRIADGKPIRTRPLCPYPQVAQYTGSGSIDEAARFACVASATTPAQAAARPAAIPLWPNGAPGAKGTDPEDVPTISLYRPSGRTAEGPAIVVCPGGGYARLADHEGHNVAVWLNSIGVTAAVLEYRLGPRYHHPAPLQDVARAIRTMRARAKEWGIDAHRVGVWGFSAGGHLASTIATQFDEGSAAAADPIDRLSSRPDVAVLAYPVISMADGVAHVGSRTNLLGAEPSADLVAALSSQTRVRPQTPPTFIFHTADDSAVPVENSLLFAAALRAARVPYELHVFETGRHGVGLAPDNPVLSVWPRLLENWLRARGFLR